MKKDALKKEIDCQISIKNNHWNAFVLSLGGSLGLIFLPFSIFKWVLVAVGLFFAGFFFYVYLNKVSHLKFLVKKLEEE